MRNGKDLSALLAIIAASGIFGQLGQFPTTYPEAQIAKDLVPESGRPLARRMRSLAFGIHMDLATTGSLSTSNFNFVSSGPLLSRLHTFKRRECHLGFWPWNSEGLIMLLLLLLLLMKQSENGAARIGGAELDLT